MDSASPGAMRLPRRLGCLLAAALVASLSAGIDSADARPYRAYKASNPQRPGLRPARPAAREAAKEKAKPAQAQPVHLIVVSIPKQRITAYGAGGFVRQGAVSTGRTGYATPTGVFSVIQKNRYHRSNIYSGAPMPFMQRITWSGVALHEGVLPGYPASHGCIRLSHAFASELWGMTRMGVRVIVTPDDLQPAELAHARLPAPAMTPLPAAVTDAQPIKPSMVAMAADKTAEAPAAATQPSAPKLSSPLDRAKAERAQAVGQAPARAKAARELAEISKTKAAEANKAIKALREAEAALYAARDRRDAAAKALEQARTPEATEKAKAALAVADARIADATETMEAAGAAETVKTREAFEAAQAAWDADKASDEAASAVRAGERAVEPISILVSRKTGKVHVRQAWKTLLEAPVTIKDADVPLGTHLYVATEMQSDGQAMRWLAATYPQSNAGPDAKPIPQRTSLRRGERVLDAAPAQPGRPRETAAGALDRIEFSEETRQFIADRLWAGASLIISDYGLSNEFGKYTDFIVQPR